jgi:hypothetical protein
VCRARQQLVVLWLDLSLKQPPMVVVFFFRALELLAAQGEERGGVAEVLEARSSKGMHTVSPPPVA